MQEILLPKMGQSVEEAEIVEWLKQEGDAVEEGEPIFTIQTDKAEVECESTASGILRKIVVDTGVEVPVLTVVALVGTADEALPDMPDAPAAAPAPVAEESPAVEEAPAAAPVAAAAPAPQAAPVAGGSPVSPRAKRLAAEKGVDASALAGSGVGGRVMEADVLMVAGKKITPTAKRMAENAGLSIASLSGTGIGGKITKDDVSAAMAAPAPAAASAEVDVEEGTIPLTPMRRIVAERMCESKLNVPHYYLSVEVDMSNCKALRKSLPYKATFNDLALYATTRALREFPGINVQWGGDHIKQMADINLGMAVALPEGLIVPVIHQAQNYSLEGLCEKTKELSDKAKTNKLMPDEYQGNTFTVSNLGAAGIDTFCAIINQPDSAILALGSMKDKVVVIDGGIQIRPMMNMTLSSDHRIIDGAFGAQFLGRLKEIIEVADF